MMQHRSDAIHLMAQKYLLPETISLMAQRYLQLARTTGDPRERSRFLDYAALYAELSEQRQTATTAGTKDRVQRQAR